MYQLKSLIDNAVEQRIKSGAIFTPDQAKTKNCEQCGQVVGMIPAIVWGLAIEKYLQYEEHEHHNPPPTQNTAVSTQIRTRADFVVLVSGIPCFITKDERDAILEAFCIGRKAVSVRDYIFDRVYAVIPFSEWEANEHRKDRRVESVGMID